MEKEEEADLFMRNGVLGRSGVQGGVGLLLDDYFLYLLVGWVIPLPGIILRSLSA